MRDFFREKLVGRVRQYGLGVAIVQILRAAVRSVHRVDQDLVFVIPKFQGYEFADPCLRPLTAERIQRAAEAKELSPGRARLLMGFLTEGCEGIGAEVDGQLAGYAWIQSSGDYTFGRRRKVKVPSGYVVMKNLHVHPPFRGQRIGQKLNAARLALTPVGQIPVVFIIPENRYAIRNWEKFGFQRVAEVKQWRWLGRPWHMRTRRLAEVSEADRIMRALEDASTG